MLIKLSDRRKTVEVKMYGKTNKNLPCQSEANPVDESLSTYSSNYIQLFKTIFLKFYIYIYLINNVVLVLGVQQRFIYPIHVFHSIVHQALYVSDLGP